MANEYVLGTSVTIRLVLKDADDVFVDPFKITMVIAQGKGNFVTKHYTTEVQDLNRVSQGIYELDFLTAVAAVHTVTSLIKSKNGSQDTKISQFLVIGIDEQARKELRKL